MENGIEIYKKYKKKLRNISADLYEIFRTRILTEEEVEEFREVMLTCKDDEVAGWCRSLQLRFIELPDELKDELFLIIGERRNIH